MTTDAKILSALRNAGENGVAGTELSRAIGVSRAAIWARIDVLRAVGFQIEASPHAGYRLISSPDRLIADDIQSLLKSAKVIGREIQVYKETKSTNDIVERLARDGVQEGVVVFAERQTAGKGRLGRSWHSPPELGLWFSVLLRPKLSAQEAVKLTITFSNAISVALRGVSGVDATIKWPNDIMVKSRKLGGILTEMSAELDSLNYALLGVGVNVNNESFPNALAPIATSLAIESGQQFHRPTLAAKLLDELDRAYDSMLSGGFPGIATEWAARCDTIGKPIRVHTGARIIEGVAESLDPDGGLLLRTEYGGIERVIGGDVTTRVS